MLGKLLKQEFRATGRIMLPMLGALIVLSILASLSGTGLINGVTNLPLLRFIMILMIVFFGIGIVAAAVVSTVIMISRFYRNLLKDEGYLMFTLPVSVHELVCSKLIVAMVWFLMTGLVIFLVMGFLALTMSNTNLEEVLKELPSIGEIREILDEFGMRVPLRKLIGIGSLAAVLSMAGSCLHFYAAMAMGHMFSEHKVLLSIVFFVLIAFAFSLMSMGFNMVNVSITVNTPQSAAEAINSVSPIMWRVVLMELIQAAVMYAATILCLKKGLNLT